MRAPSMTLALAVALFAGCGGGCSGSTDEGRASSGTTASSTASRTEASGSERTDDAVAEPAADPGPRPELRLVGEPAHYGDAVAIRVENRGAEARLSGTLKLQRERDGTWADVDGVSLGLRFSCEDETPECVTLAPGAIYLPPEWLGTVGDAQCICTRCAPAETGTYRFVATSCGGGHTLEGEPFHVD